MRFPSAAQLTRRSVRSPLRIVHPATQNRHRRVSASRSVDLFQGRSRASAWRSSEFESISYLYIVSGMSCRSSELREADAISGGEFLPKTHLAPLGSKELNITMDDPAQSFPFLNVMVSHHVKNVVYHHQMWIYY